MLFLNLRKSIKKCKQLTYRAVLSLFCISATEPKHLLWLVRLALFIIIFKSVLRRIIYELKKARGRLFSPILAPYFLPSCIIRISFHGIRMKYYIRRGEEDLILVNPYLHEYDIREKLLKKIILLKLQNEKVAFVDVGAHVGTYSIFVSLLLDGRGEVIAIEPSPYNIAHLSQNLRINNVNNVKIINKGIMGDVGVRKLYFATGCSGNASFIKEWNIGYSGELKTYLVNVCPLDQALSECLGESFLKLKYVLKIDTEGLDFDVLLSGPGVLKNTIYIIVESSSKEILPFLELHGFKCEKITNLVPSYIIAEK